MKYADAGVNIAVADEAKQRIRHHASRTFTPGVLGGIGSFGALFALDHKKWKEPVLVSSADGVGTKLKVAMAMGVHSTVGGDLVNHCINDILVQGAEPLFFLDYLAMGKLEPQVVEQLVEGMSRSCRKAGCALIGGETAEMPGFYPPGEYDLAGFIVGVVDRKKLLTGKQVQPGDALLALPSAGLHTNGYSLARKLIFEVEKLKSVRTSPRSATKSGQNSSSRISATRRRCEASSQKVGSPRSRTSPGAAFPETCRESCRAASKRKSIWPPGPFRQSSNILPNSGRLTQTNCCSLSIWAWG